jgi:hypothetical protein
VTTELERVVIRDGEGEKTEVSLPSIGLGTMRTAATYAALMIQLEGGRSSQVSVLDSVMEELGIHPAEIEHNRRMPDVVYEDEWENWNAEGERLRAKLGV